MTQCVAYYQPNVKHTVTYVHVCIDYASIYVHLSWERVKLITYNKTLQNKQSKNVPVYKILSMGCYHLSLPTLVIHFVQRMM